MKANSLTERALGIVRLHGKRALDEACRRILKSDYGDETVNDAAKYYAQVTLARVLPIFPTLLRLSCKAAGGNPEKTNSLAPALMIITASGDIHDDVVDRSKRKCRRETVFGRYGREVALLVGDAFLIQGLTILNGCRDLSVEQRQAIFDLTEKSMFESIKAELVETRLWKKRDVTPQEYFEVINLKGSVAELVCRIGGVVGCADEKALAEISRFGRVIGVLSSVKDEFMDMQNLPELRHRVKYELPPYPVIYASQNPLIKKKIEPALKRREPLKKDLQSMAETVLKSEEVKKLKAELAELGKRELEENSLLKGERASEAAVILRALATEM